MQGGFCCKKNLSEKFKLGLGYTAPLQCNNV
jgi:hypothetical protein